MVSEYNNTECKYNIDKLEKVVYLIHEDDLRDIHIDNGEAYVDEISATPLSLKVYDIELQDTDELDERYKFTHTLTFSMNGYATYKDFEGKYYAIVKTVDGEYWLVNPMFPCKVTYTYTLDGNGSHTDFTMSTISNHPTLRIHGIEHDTPYECGYQYCRFETLRLNETKYSKKVGNEVKYVNDGFKDVVFNKNSAIFTEQFDGTNVQHSITFNIKFDDYKSSWHYNLLEFTENLYAAIIKSTCGKYILVGFHFGLQPSFTVTANDEMTMNNIQIQLIDAHDNGDFVLETYDEIEETYVSGVTYEFTLEYDAYECVSAGVAKYLLKREVDAFGNPTGRYQCLQGYEDRFSFLGDKLIGTFSEVIEYPNPKCECESCNIHSSLPNTIIFNSVSCRQYSFMADTDWTLESSNNGITVSPSSGVANQQYMLEVCNTITPTSAEVTSTIVAHYCGTEKVYNVVVVENTDCFVGGKVFNITAEAQYVTVPTECCIDTVTDTTGIAGSITIQNSYIKIFVPQNSTGAVRVITLIVTLCDGSTAEIIINQGIIYERWVKEDTLCVADKMCDLERKYTGTTAEDINTRTNETRYTNCVVSSECASITRWIETSRTTCYNNKKYYIQIEQISTDGGQTWTNTGNERLGSETPDSPAECDVEYEYRWLLTSETTCIGYNKYYLYKLQQRAIISGADWEDVVPTQKSYNGNGTMTPQLAEADSPDCGYVPPIEPIYKWETNGWMCDDCDGNDGYAVIYSYYEDDPSTILYESSSCDEGVTVPHMNVLTATFGTCVSEIPNWLFASYVGYTNETLYRVDIPDSVTSIGDYAFYNCKHLLNFSLPNSITSIGDCAFQDCTELSTINLPNSLTSLGEEAFENCLNFQYINIPSGLTVIQRYTFNNCAGLSDIIIPDSVTSIGDYAFNSCIGLSYLSIGSGVTSIGDYAFNNCSRLIKATVYATTPPTLGSGAFSDTNNCPIYVPSGSVEAYKAASGWSAYSNRIQAIS